MKTYHYRVDGEMYPICGTQPDNTFDLAVYYGYFLGLAREYPPGVDMDRPNHKTRVVLCPDCCAHPEVVMALLGAT